MSALVPKVHHDTLRGPLAGVGVDQSLTGFAVTFLDAEGGYRTVSFSTPSTDKLARRIWALGRALRDELLHFEDALEGDIAVEAPVLRSPSALISGQLFHEVLTQIMEGAFDAPLMVPPTMLKKFVTGKGTGVQKNQMLLETYKRWGAEFKDDNAADSFGLAKIAAGEATTEFQREILTKVQDEKFRAW